MAGEALNIYQKRSFLTARLSDNKNRDNSLLVLSYISDAIAGFGNFEESQSCAMPWGPAFLYRSADQAKGLEITNDS